MIVSPNKRARAFVTRSLVAAVALGALNIANADDHGPVHYLNIQTIKPATRADFDRDAPQRHAKPQGGREHCLVADVGGSDPTLVLFESWRDRDGYNQHEASAHVAPVIALVPTGFAEPERKYLLQDVAGLPAATRKPIPDPSGTRNIVARLRIHPEQREQFTQAAAALLQASRSTPGNLVFNVYQDRSAPDDYVVYERWSDADTCLSAHK